MFCGAFTTRMKPKLTRCSTNGEPQHVDSGRRNPAADGEQDRIIVAASAVALAKPGEMTTRRTARLTGESPTRRVGSPLDDVSAVHPTLGFASATALAAT